jgi:hypothetical protein
LPRPAWMPQAIVFSIITNKKFDMIIMGFIGLNMVNNSYIISPELIDNSRRQSGKNGETDFYFYCSLLNKLFSYRDLRITIPFSLKSKTKEAFSS